MLVPQPGVSRRCLFCRLNCAYRFVDHIDRGASLQRPFVRTDKCAIIALACLADAGVVLPNRRPVDRMDRIVTERIEIDRDATACSRLRAPLHCLQDLQIVGFAKLGIFT